MTLLRDSERTLTLAAMQAHGGFIADRLAPPALVTLTGDLGAGKTTLVQSICAALGVEEPVTSPTFALIHEYRGRDVRVVHCDLYRLRSARELAMLGLDEYLADPDTITLVEWPERAEGLLPTPTLALSLTRDPGDEDVRRLYEVWA